MLGAVEGPTVRLTGPSVPAALPLLVPGTAPQHELLTWIPIAGDKFGLFEAEALVQGPRSRTERIVFPVRRRYPDRRGAHPASCGQGPKRRPAPAPQDVRRGSRCRCADPRAPARRAAPLHPWRTAPAAPQWLSAGSPGTRRATARGRHPGQEQPDPSKHQCPLPTHTRRHIPDSCLPPLRRYPHKRKAQTRGLALFESRTPGEQPLPLLSFEPGGVGGATAARLSRTFRI